MKTLLSTKPWQIVLFMCIIASLAVSACKDDDGDIILDPIKRSTAQFSGANEVPAITSTGTGSADLVYDGVTKILTYKITWQLGSTTATTANMHFHGAEDGSPAKSSPVIIPITGFSTASGGTLTGATPVLTDAQVNQLMSEKWYLNIHSSTVPSGEIRANIKF